MKKVLLLSVMALVSLALNAQQLAFAKMQAPAMQEAVEENSSMEFGYCGDFYGGLGFGAGTGRALIEIPETTAQKFNGAQVTSVKVGIGTYGLNPKAKIIILKDLNVTDPVYSQDFKPKQNNWTEVELETPFTITGEKFYIGYQIYSSSQNNYPLGIDDSKANPLGDIAGILNPTTNKYEYMNLGEQGFNNTCIKLILTGENLPAYDLAIEKVSAKSYVKTGSPFSVTVDIKNMATQTINTFDVAYQIGNADAQNMAVTIDGGLANSKTYSFAIDNLVINEDGEYDVTITISNPNGQADEYDSDNTSSTHLTASSFIVPRKLLLENFSTQRCGYCPPAHEMLNEIVKDRNDIAWIGHHTGFYEDIFTIAASRSYLWFYGSSQTFAPAIMLDRRNLCDLGAEGVANAPVFSPAGQDAVEELIDYCLDIPSFIGIDLEGGYNKDTRELTIKVVCEKTMELETAPVLNIFLTEDGLMAAQSGASENYIHNHVIRKVMTATWGDAITWDGNKYEATYTCTLDASWKPENMTATVFVSDYNSRNYNECAVHNTEWISIAEISAVNKVTNDLHSVAAFGKTINIDGEYNNAAIYTIDGRLVQQARGNAYITLNNAGIYIVVVDGVSHKVVIR